MVNFSYHDVLPISEDNTKYRLLTPNYIKIEKFCETEILKIKYEGLELLAEKAFSDVSHFLRSSHLSCLSKILKDPDSSKNDKYVALEFLKNAVISAEEEFPMCQDTGTAIVMGKKGQHIWTEFCDEKALTSGIYNAYTKKKFKIFTKCSIITL